MASPTCCSTGVWVYFSFKDKCLYQVIWNLYASCWGCCCLKENSVVYWDWVDRSASCSVDLKQDDIVGRAPTFYSKILARKLLWLLAKYILVMCACIVQIQSAVAQSSLTRCHATLHLQWCQFVVLICSQRPWLHVFQFIIFAYWSHYCLIKHIRGNVTLYGITSQ